MPVKIRVTDDFVTVPPNPQKSTKFENNSSKLGGNVEDLEGLLGAETKSGSASKTKCSLFFPILFKGF